MRNSFSKVQRARHVSYLYIKGIPSAWLLNSLSLNCVFASGRVFCQYLAKVRVQAHTTSSHYLKGPHKAQHNQLFLPHRTSLSHQPVTKKHNRRAASTFIMTSKLVPKNPSEVMVIRKLTPNITTLSVPFLRFGRIRIGGRATIGNLHR